MKALRLFFYFVFSLLCIGVAGYAFYFVSAFGDSNAYMQKKFANAGWEVYGHFIRSGLALLLVPFQMSKNLRQISKTTSKWIKFYYC